MSDTPTILYPQEATLVPYDDIDQSLRAREDLGDIQGLAKSMAMFGVLQLPICTNDPERPGKLVLLDGGRRMATYKLLSLNPCPVLIRRNVPREQWKDIELEANEKRLKMKWQERVACIAQGHQYRVIKGLETDTSWTQEMSGEVFGCGRTSVRNALLIYEFMQDPEILKAPTITDALEIAIARQEAAGQAEVARRAQEHLFHLTPSDGEVTVVPQVTVSESAASPKFIKPVDSTISRFLTPSSQPESPPSAAENGANQVVRSQPMKKFNMSKRFILGDCVEVMKTMRAQSFDHCVTDPPYAINMANLKDIQDIEIVKEEHDIVENLDLYERSIPEIYRLLRPHAYFVFWYDLDNHNMLQTLCRKVGFKVQRWPLTWHKLHPCQNKQAGVNFTKTTEWAMVCRKDSAALQKSTSTSVIPADGKLEQAMYNNPFAKPRNAWKFIFDAIAHPGQEVLDPFGGEFSMARCAINEGLLPTSIELKEEHYNKGTNAIRTLLTTMTGGNISFE